MAYLFGIKSLPKPMLTYCQLDPQEQTSVKYKYFHSIEFEDVVCEMAAI